MDGGYFEHIIRYRSVKPEFMILDCPVDNADVLRKRGETDDDKRQNI